MGPDEEFLPPVPLEPRGRGFGDLFGPPLRLVSGERLRVPESVVIEFESLVQAELGVQGESADEGRGR